MDHSAMAHLTLFSKIPIGVTWITCFVNRHVHKFLQKQKELDSFVSPAQEIPGSKFRSFFGKLTQNYFQNNLDVLVNHYQTWIETLCTQILNMDVSTSNVETSMQIALKRGRKNLLSKWKQCTIVHWKICFNNTDIGCLTKGNDAFYKTKRYHSMILEHILIILQLLSLSSNY
jgi:hypothetical protein